MSASTISALATSPGKSGVAIIRISGALANQIAQKLTNTKPKPRLAKFTSFINANNKTIDSGLILYFPAPNSFTGEDLIELHCHGSPIVIQQLLRRSYELGAEAAKAGEFSERAFTNNKMDLLQAEAVMDIINASSIEAAQAAQATLSGKFSQFIEAISEQFIQLRATVELALDFPDEEEYFINKEKVKANTQQLQQSLQKLIEQAQFGQTLTEATAVAIIGAPNVGKSTLMNCLLGQDKAIVTNIAGTTRDLIEAELTIDDLPITLIDTAGICQSTDEIEQQGIERSLSILKEVGLVLYVTEIKQKSNTELDTIIQTKQKVIRIINKCDIDGQKPRVEGKSTPTIHLSAKKQLGIGLLKQQIFQLLNYQHRQSHFSAHAHHVHSLNQASEYLNEAVSNLSTQPEITAESIKLAHQELQKITGKVSPDELLGRIFSTFCIGK